MSNNYAKYLISNDKKQSAGRLSSKNHLPCEKKLSLNNNNIYDKPSKILGNQLVYNLNSPRMNILNTNKTSKDNLFSIDNDRFSNNEIIKKNSKNTFDLDSKQVFNQNHNVHSNDKIEKEKLENTFKIMKEKIQNLEIKNFEKDRLLRDKDKRIKDLIEINKKLESEMNLLKAKSKNVKKNNEDEELVLALAKIEEMERKENINREKRSTSLHNRFSNPIGINFEPSDVINVDLIDHNLMFNEIFGNNIRNLEVDVDPFSEYENHIINEVCPNPDNMTYEQLLDLGDKVGTVSKGFTKKEIEKIPSIRFNKNIYKNNDKCIVCQFEFNDYEVLRKLSCGHFYHKACVDEWLLKEKRCPVCKNEVKIK